MANDVAPGGVGGGVKMSKVREISRTAEKIDKKKFCRKNNQNENFKVTKLQGLKSISGMQLS